MKARILFLSILFATVVGRPLYGAADEALRLTTSSPTVFVGDEFTVSVVVSSTKQSMNAVSGTLVYPGSLGLSTINKQGSIISFWTQEAQSRVGRVPFEGVIVNPGYQGPNGKVFSATFVAKKEGVATLSFADGAILANDGLGTNIVESLGTLSVTVRAATTTSNAQTVSRAPLPAGGIRVVALPVITEYSEQVASAAAAFVKGKGEPNALTKLVFNDVSKKSLGEEFISFLQPKKKKLDAVLVKNNDKGEFEYQSDNNLVAGTYNATPFLVDGETQTERPGLGVRLFVNDSTIVKFLVVLINVLGLLIPVVGLVVVIYFIPWYSWRRMRVIRKRLGLEEEKIELSEHQLKREDTLLDRAIDQDKH